MIGKARIDLIQVDIGSGHNRALPASYPVRSTAMWALAVW